MKVKNMKNSNEYIRSYTKKHCRRISLCLSLDKDKDILEAIEEVSPGNIQQGIKKLIRSAIEAENVLYQF